MTKVILITNQMVQQQTPHLHEADIGKWAVQTKSSTMVQQDEQQARRLAMYLTNTDASV